MPDGETTITPVTRPKLPGRRVLEIEKIHEALTNTKGDRDKAAVILGVSTGVVSNYIKRCPQLALHWSKEGAEAKAQVKNEAGETQIEKLARETLERYVSDRVRLVRQIDSLDNRMQRAEEARNTEKATEDMLPDDIIFQRRNAFKENQKGEPSEEAMVREAFYNLTDQLRLLDESMAGLLLTKEKINALTREATKGSGRAGPRPTRMITKARMLNERNNGSVHLHVAPGAQAVIAVKENGTKG